MAWFHGTFPTEEERLEKEYPVRVTEELRTNADGTKLAFINRFAEEDPLSSLADPKAELGRNADDVFLHPFFDADAAAARTAVEAFLHGPFAGCSEGIALFRLEDGELTQYSDGHLSASRVWKQDALRKLLPEAYREKEAFLVPLKRFFHPCPVCGYRMLQYRGMCEICEECGWEDEGIDGDDDPPRWGANGDTTIRQYRTEYLALKKADPQYHWWDPSEKEEKQ